MSDLDPCYTVQKTTRSFYSRYRVIELDEFILLEASSLRQQFSMSYWDSLIVAATLATNATILYSEDMQHGQVINGRLTIINPFLTN